MNSTLQASETKDCASCQKPFAPRNSMQRACRPLCAQRLAVAQRKALAIRERGILRARKEAAKTRRELEAEAWTAFSKYVRFRDVSAGHGCIDCGKPFEANKPGGSIDAGHYLSRGSAPPLKFDERNVFAQRKNCNRPGGTTREAFRAGVIARIGLAAVEALEADQSVKQYRADDYRRIRDTYRARLREAARGIV